jgi:hypothetical protein
VLGSGEIYSTSGKSNARSGFQNKLACRFLTTDSFDKFRIGVQRTAFSVQGLPI